MTAKLSIAIAQLNFTVGDLTGNLQKHIDAAIAARDQSADIIVFPELSLTGYPPEDLLLRPKFIAETEHALQQLAAAVRDIYCVVGHPYRTVEGLFNACSIIHNGQIIGRYAKQHLPNYGVFDEHRYFTPGNTHFVTSIKDIPVGIVICEDLWFAEPVKQAVTQGAQLIISPNASPFETNKNERRLSILVERTKANHVPIIYANCIGGQDDLIFDGGSMLIDAEGNLTQQATFFKEELLVIKYPTTSTEKAAATSTEKKAATSTSEKSAATSTFEKGATTSIFEKAAATSTFEKGAATSTFEKAAATSTFEKAAATSTFEKGAATSTFPPFEKGGPGGILRKISNPSTESHIYQALALALKDYVEKNHFPGVLIGVSGGIDSALTLALAVDALGKDRVRGIIMPSHFTSDLSMEEALAVTKNLDVKHDIISIEPVNEAFLNLLTPHFADKQPDVTEQNIQARCRAVLLMALSNKTGWLVVTTGNRSEIAVGYCTLYGDMVGGFAVLKDVPKTLVYRLAHYRNSLSPDIPPRTIERAPTAELAPNQKDQDSLPPYDVLDAILELYLNQQLGIEEIVVRGFEQETVARVIRLIRINEYKRRQSAIGPRINHTAFSKDRRYPITNGWKG